MEKPAIAQVGKTKWRYGMIALLSIFFLFIVIRGVLTFAAMGIGLFRSGYPWWLQLLLGASLIAGFAYIVLNFANLRRQERLRAPVSPRLSIPFCAIRALCGSINASP